MSKIKVLNFKNFIGIEELGLQPGKINIFRGPKGSGKSSIIEGIEKLFTNMNRRTELIRHGEEEAILFAALDDGLEIDRRIRSEKADYLRVRKEAEAVPSHENFIRSFINGDIFRPIEWVNKSNKEQTSSILKMLQIEWSQQNIIDWFGELTCNIDYEQHILQVLKAIEVKYYKDREVVNREIKELRTQINVILKELPPGYEGELWREKKVQDYYSKVSEAKDINKWIDEAKALQENITTKIAAAEAKAASEEGKIRLTYKDKRQDIKDIISFSKNRIEKSKDALNNLEEEVNSICENIDRKTELKIQEAIQILKQEGEEAKALERKKAKQFEEEQKDLIAINENKISAKGQEIISLDSTEEQEIKNVKDMMKAEIEKIQIIAGRAAEYLKTNEPIDIEPLQKSAEEVALMQSYLRQWDMMLEIRDKKLASRERYAATLTARIETARKLPTELLKSAKMPIDGVSVDDKGLIRINGTLIDGLSDGEKLELAMKIAREQAGELKVICLDKWESLNDKAQQRLIEEMEKDEFQYFITEASDTEADKIHISKAQ
jgi:energy-coupling factor transporter ATP-binding protein EcfA2